MISSLVNKCKFTSYLEIGIKNGKLYKNIKCKNKLGVDPSPIWSDDTICHKTSDEFFKTNKRTFDIIFIDGWHESEQVLRDINNSLNFLNPNGFILMHDCNPSLYDRQKAPTPWNGDCWKALVKARTIYPYEIFTVDADQGIGVINTRKTSKKTFNINEILTYNYLETNRSSCLNLKTKEFFKKFVDDL